MELTAVIQALKSIPLQSTLALYTDSKYVINGLNHLDSSIGRNQNGLDQIKKSKNKDLWIELDTLTKRF